MIKSINSMAPRTGRVRREDDSTINTADLIESTIGGKNFEFISDTAVHTPPEGYNYIAIQVLEDAVLSNISPIPLGNTFTGQPLPEQDVTYGKFTLIQLSSGKVKAYLGAW